VSWYLIPSFDVNPFVGSNFVRSKTQAWTWKNTFEIIFEKCCDVGAWTGAQWIVDIVVWAAFVNSITRHGISRFWRIFWWKEQIFSFKETGYSFPVCSAVPQPIAPQSGRSQVRIPMEVIGVFYCLNLSRTHHVPRVDPACNRSQYQECHLGCKLCHFLVPIFKKFWEPQPPGAVRGLP
jgi:hypothetical protein